VLLAAACRAVGADAGVRPEAGAGDPSGVEVDGVLLSRYRARFAGGEHDHDLDEVLDVSLADEGGRWRGRLSAQATLDLDGRSDGSDTTFFSLRDTYDHALTARVLFGWVDVLGIERIELLRVGRQVVHEAPVAATFDGLRFESERMGPLRSRFGVYGGLGEHPYESSSDGDLVAGVFGEVSPWQGAALRADWMHLEDDTVFGDASNDLFGLAWWQDLATEDADATTRLETRATVLDGEARDLAVTASRVDAPADLLVQARLYRLLEAQNQLSAPLDPFSPTLFELSPYRQLGLLASKSWDWGGLQGGADVRRVVDPADVGEYNRDFERAFLTATVTDALPVVVAVTGERWSGEDEIETWGIDLRRTFDPELDVAVGSYYSLFKYDLFSDVERDHVRTYYVDLRARRARARTWSVRYELEQNDFDRFHTLRIDWAWRF